MNNNRNKYIAIILGAAVLLCCLGVVAVVAVGGYAVNQVSQSITDDPAKVAAIGEQMLNYDVPSGYKELMAMELMGARMLIIGPKGGLGGTVLMLMQVPDGGSDLSEEEMRQQMEDALARQQGNSGQYTYETVDEQKVTVNGEEITLLVREGENSRGQKMRQATAVLKGKTAPVMFMAMGDPENWDQDALDEFLASIR